MPQRNIQPGFATLTRPATVAGVLQLGGVLLLALVTLVLLITNGGAG